LQKAEFVDLWAKREGVARGFGPMIGALVVAFLLGGGGGSALAQPIAGTGERSYIDLRDQGIHYLRMGKRALALESLERSLQLGGSDDEKLVLVLAKLHQDDGNLGRAFDVLNEGPPTEKVSSYKAQLSSQYAPVQLVASADRPKDGYLALLPDSAIIHPEKKAYFQTLVEGQLSRRVRLPIRLLLPTGTYHVNGRALEVVAGQETRVEVPFFDIAVAFGRRHAPRGPEAAQRLERELGCHELRVVDRTDKERSGNGITDLAKREPSLLVTLGREAAQRAFQDLRSIPLLALDLEEAEGSRIVRRHGAATAVWNDLPRGRLFAMAKGLMPGIDRIGVLLNRDRSWAVYEAALSDRPPGIRFVPELVVSKQGLAEHLRSLRPMVDALWLLPDPQVFDAATIRTVANWGYLNNVPVLAERVELVHEGVMLAAEVRWADVARLGLEQARLLLWKERSPGSVPPLRVDEPSWGVSTVIFRHLGTTMSAELTEKAAVKAETLPQEGGPKR